MKRNAVQHMTCAKLSTRDKTSLLIMKCVVMCCTACQAVSNQAEFLRLSTLQQNKWNTPLQVMTLLPYQKSESYEKGSDKQRCF
jgi:hypothetical protein